MQVMTSVSEINYLCSLQKDAVDWPFCTYIPRIQAGLNSVLVTSMGILFSLL